jgi:chromosome partitioning protein
MPHVIAIVAPVRNSGKTTAAVNIAAALAILDQKTLLIDCDPEQGVWAGASLLAATGNSGGFYAVMTGRAPMEAAILQTSLPNLDLLPAGADFSKADFLFENTDGDAFRLRDLISRKTEAYHYVIINGPPAEMPGLLGSVLISSEWMIIPLRGDMTTPIELLPWLAGIGDLVKRLAIQQKQWELSVHIAGILLNRCPPREENADGPAEIPMPALEDLAEFIFTTRIPLSTELVESFALGKPAAVYHIDSDAAVAFMDLAEEVIQKIS